MFRPARVRGDIGLLRSGKLQALLLRQRPSRPRAINSTRDGRKSTNQRKCGRPLRGTDIDPRIIGF
jgi:hypothetical protein